MSSLIRFEFYNNLNIWYDLYQENGGDPNLFINMMTLYMIGETIIDYQSGSGYSFGNSIQDYNGSSYGNSDEMLTILSISLAMGCSDEMYGYFPSFGFLNVYGNGVE